MKFTTDIEGLHYSSQQMRGQLDNLLQIERTLISACQRLHGAGNFNATEAHAITIEVRHQADKLSRYIELLTYWADTLELAEHIKYVPDPPQIDFQLFVQTKQTLVTGTSIVENVVRAAVQEVADAGHQLLQHLGGSLLEGFKVAHDTVGEVIAIGGQTIELVGDFIGGIFKSAGDILGGIIHNLIQGFQQAMNGAAGLLHALVGFIGDRIHDGYNTAVGVVNSIGNVFHEEPSPDIKHFERLDLDTTNGKYDWQAKGLLNSMKLEQRIEKDFNDGANSYLPFRWIGGIGAGDQPNSNRYNDLINKLNTARQRLRSSDPAEVAIGQREIAETIDEMQKLDQQWTGWMSRYSHGLDVDMGIAKTALVVDLAVIAAIGTTLAVPAVFGIAGGGVLGTVSSVGVAGGIGFVHGAGQDLLLDFTTGTPVDMNQVLKDGATGALTNSISGFAPVGVLGGSGIQMLIGGMQGGVSQVADSISNGQSLDLRKVVIAFGVGAATSKLGGSGENILRSTVVNMGGDVLQESGNELLDGKFDAKKVFDPKRLGTETVTNLLSALPAKIKNKNVVTIDIPPGQNQAELSRSWAQLLGKGSNKSPLELYQIARSQGFSKPQALVLAETKVANIESHYGQSDPKPGNVANNSVVVTDPHSSVEKDILKDAVKDLYKYIGSDNAPDPGHQSPVVSGPDSDSKVLAGNVA